MDSLFLFRRWYRQNSFQNELDFERSLLKTVGAAPFNPFIGEVPVVVVAFTDMVMSGGLGGRAGAESGGAVGPNERAAAVMEWVGSVTAGEFGSWMLSMLWAVWAEAVLDPDDEDSPLGLYRNPVCKVGQEGGW
jgi:hypothetical protein